MAEEDLREVKPSHGMLYIPMRDIADKRKSILTSIKDSLLLQEEYEKLLEIRKAKTIILKDIKVAMDDLNKSYQKIKKAFPNIKNVLSHTEREIGELEYHIKYLQKHMKADERDIEMLKQLEEKAMVNQMIPGGPLAGRKVIKHKEEKHEKEEDHKDEKKKKVHKKKHHKKVIPKMDRIKHNLNVIEDKLNNL